MVSFKAASVLLLSLASLANTAFAVVAGTADMDHIHNREQSSVGSRYSVSLAEFGQGTAGQPASPDSGVLQPPSKKRSSQSSEDTVPGAPPLVLMQDHDNPNQTVSATTTLHTHTSSGVIVTHTKTATAKDSASSRNHAPAPSASSIVTAVTPSSSLDAPHSMSDHPMHESASVDESTSTALVSVSVSVSTRTIKASTTRTVFATPSVSPSGDSGAKTAGPQLGWAVVMAAGVAVAF